MTRSLSRSGAHHGARSPITSVTVSGFSTSQPWSSSSARSTSPWCRSSPSASDSSPPSSGEIGSSRNRGASASVTSASMCSSRTLLEPDRGDLGDLVDDPVGRWPARRATHRAAATGAADPDPVADDVLLEEVLPHELLQAPPRSSLRFGISAVCGIGSPSGCLNSAVTANQSAIAPTIEASAPALTKPQKPSWPSVATYTTAAKTSSPTAIERIRRSPARRSASAAGSPAIIGAWASAAWSPCPPILPQCLTRLGKCQNPRMPRTVLTFGTFDVFHLGHLRVIERAAALGDRLVVGVSADALNLRKKGREPVFSQHERLAIVAALKPVDEVFVEESLELKRHYIEQYAADVLVMGDDWAGRFDEFADICEVVYLPRTPAISTTALIEKISGTEA